MPSNTHQPTAVTEPTPEELAIAQSGPAIYANRFFVVVGPGGVRVAFAENVPGGVSFRNAVLLSFGDAISLKNVLAEMLKDIESQIAAAQQQQPPQQQK